MAVAKAAADGKVSVQVRAIGCDGEVQDSKIEDMYNVRGIMNNALEDITFTMQQ